MAQAEGRRKGGHRIDVGLGLNADQSILAGPITKSNLDYRHVMHECVSKVHPLQRYLSHLLLAFFIFLSPLPGRPSSLFLAQLHNKPTCNRPRFLQRMASNVRRKSYKSETQYVSVNDKCSQENLASAQLGLVWRGSSVASISSHSPCLMQHQPRWTKEVQRRGEEREDKERLRIRKRIMRDAT